MNFSRRYPMWMQPTGQPEQAVFRSSMSLANFSPLMPSMRSGSLVAWRLRQGRDLSASSAATFPAVPRSWYLLIMEVSVIWSWISLKHWA